MTSLWSSTHEKRRRAVEPLAVRMRPRSLDEFVGQSHIVGPDCLLPRMLEADRLASVIVYGPPGTGKTTLAEVIAHHTGAHFERANAAMIGVKDIRRIIDQAKARLEMDSRRSILFLDEIHRFSRSQQDVLLGDVERGTLILIGATTENPYFAVNSALISRSTVFQFKPLTEDDIADVLRQALHDARGLGDMAVTIDDDAIAHWARQADGDARRALNALEIAVRSASTGQTDFSPSDSAPIHIDLRAAEQSIQHKALVYDGTGDEHYDVISAFIKSMRGSDPDAAVYWLARMLESGEDPRFIARRIAIFASEDVGNADPQAIQVASAAWQLTERIGLPECQLTLSQAAIYMALAPKSKASANAIWSAASDVRNNATVPVPRHLRDAHYKGAEALGHGQNYVDPQRSADGYVSQEYLGVDRVYFSATERGWEGTHIERLARLRAGTESERNGEGQTTT